MSKQEDYVMYKIYNTVNIKTGFPVIIASTEKEKLLVINGCRIKTLVCACTCVFVYVCVFYTSLSHQAVSDLQQDKESLLKLSLIV